MILTERIDMKHSLISFGIVGAIGLIIVLMGAIPTPENTQNFNCSSVCKMVDSLEPELHSILYDPIDGRKVCYCKSGAVIQVALTMLARPKHMNRANTKLTLPRDIFIEVTHDDLSGKIFHLGPMERRLLQMRI